MTAILVLAKSPRPGRSKTRLCPPCTLEEAAGLARAALVDTLEAVSRVDARRVLFLDGPRGDFVPAGFEVLGQRGGDLGNRLAGAFDDAGGPAVLIGMDTPQVTPALLRNAMAELARPGVDAVLGAAADGGYWAIGLNEADAAAFDGVPMSTDRTGAVQRRRLRELGLSVAELPVLRDVDEVDDARAVAYAAPELRFSARWRTVEAAIAARRVAAGSLAGRST